LRGADGRDKHVKDERRGANDVRRKPDKPHHSNVAGRSALPNRGVRHRHHRQRDNEDNLLKDPVHQSKPRLKMRLFLKRHMLILRSSACDPMAKVFSKFRRKRLGAIPGLGA
jgi:hypothetical protein